MPWIVRLILFVSLMLLSEFYFFKRLFSSIKLVFPDSKLLASRWIKIVILSFLNFVPLSLLLTYILRILGGPDIDLPEKSNLFDFLFYYPFWFSILVFLQVVVIILPLDLIRLILLPITKNRFKRVHAKVILFISLTFLFYVPIRIIFDMTQVSVRNTTYEMSNLPDDLNNLKIGLISDIQADWYNSNERIEKYISSLNENEPDIVFIPGDMITNDQNSIPVAAGFAGKIKTQYGVYACVGDHDNWAFGRDILKSRTEVIKQLAKFNILMFDDENKIIRIDSSLIGMTFVTDTYSERIDPELLDSLTHSLPIVDLKIMITHQPNGKMRKSALDNHYNLMLAGHTHGGQVTLFFPFINLTPTLFETKYVKGDFWFGNLLMVVNGGLGMSLAPIRYNSTPEVTIITLKKK